MKIFSGKFHKNLTRNNGVYEVYTLPHQPKSRTTIDLLLIKEHNYNGKKYNMPFTEVSC